MLLERSVQLVGGFLRVCTARNETCQRGSSSADAQARVHCLNVIEHLLQSAATHRLRNIGEACRRESIYSRCRNSRYSRYIGVAVVGLGEVQVQNLTLETTVAKHGARCKRRGWMGSKVIVDWGCEWEGL